MLITIIYKEITSLQNHLHIICIDNRKWFLLFISAKDRMAFPGLGSSFGISKPSAYLPS
jgi:hypothetical protein